MSQSRQIDSVPAKPFESLRASELAAASNEFEPFEIWRSKRCANNSRLSQIERHSEPHLDFESDFELLRSPRVREGLNLGPVVLGQYYPPNGLSFGVKPKLRF